MTTGSPQRHAFIGVGTMGSLMAACLLDAGIELAVHDLRRAAAEPLLERGARWADTPRQAGEDAAVVWASLPGPDQVVSALLGDETGALAGMAPGSILVDTTTDDPDVARRVAAACEASGCAMLDAPVSGRPPNMTMMVDGVGGSFMVRLGGTATIAHLEVFQGLETLFRRRGIEMDWVLYSDYDVMVDAFANGDIDLAWNGPLGYVKIKRLLDQQCHVIAMRDVDIDFTTHFITRNDSGIDTVEDLKGRRFAFGRRSSEQAGLVPYYLLKQAGINPSKDLAEGTFYEQRQSSIRSDERDVLALVVSGEFDAGAVSQRTMEAVAAEGTLPRDQVRIFYSSPPYSHCCFTAKTDLDASLAREIESAFLSVTGEDEVERAVLKGEACNSFVPGIQEGWSLIEAAAISEGLV